MTTSTYRAIPYRVCSMGVGTMCSAVRLLFLTVMLFGPLPLFAQQVGSLAPEFTLETFDGRKVSLSELQGKDVCIMTWASWCPFCKASMPGLYDFYQNAKKAGRAIEVVAVAIRDTPEKARQVYKERGLPYPTGMETADFEKLYPVSRKTPSWIMVDKQGIVREVSSGRATRRDIEVMFDNLK